MWQHSTLLDTRIKLFHTEILYTYFSNLIEFTCNLMLTHIYITSNTRFVVVNVIFKVYQIFEFGSYP